MDQLRAIAIGAFVLIAAFWAGTAVEATAQELHVASPFVGSVWQMDVDQAEKQLVFSTANGTAALIDLERPEKYEVLRSPIRVDQQRRGVGVAISPDGKFVALGLQPLLGAGSAVRLGTGEIRIMSTLQQSASPAVFETTATLRVPTRIPKLKFSPDGKFLVAALTDGCGVRVWAAGSWRLIGEDHEGFAPAGLNHYCGEEERLSADDRLDEFVNYDIVFTAPPESRTFFVSGRTGVRKYEILEAGIRLVGPTATPEKLGITTPRGLALDSTGTRLAIGDNDSPRVAIVNADTLEPAGPRLLTLPEDYLSEAGKKQNDVIFPHVVWMRDGAGEYLEAGGLLLTNRLSPAGRSHILDTGAQARTAFGNYVNNVVRWVVADKPELLAFGNDTIMALRPSNAPGRTYVAAYNAVGMLNSTAAPEAADRDVYLGRKQSPDFRFGRLDSSADGRELRFTNYYGSERRLVFSFKLDQLTLAAWPANLRKAQLLVEDHNFAVTAADLNDAAIVTGNKREFRYGLPRFFGKDFAAGGKFFDPAHLNPNERTSSLAVSANKDLLLWGTSNALRLVKVEPDKLEVVCALPIRYEADSVTFAAGNALAVVAHSDGAIGWYRIAPEGDGSCNLKPVLTLYAEARGDHHWIWVAFRPDGHFYSNGLDKGLLGWQSVDKFGRVTFDDIVRYIPLYLDGDAIKKSLDAARAAEAPVFHPNIAVEDNASITRDARAGDVLAQQNPYQVTLIEPVERGLSEAIPLKLKMKVEGIEASGDSVEARFFINSLSVAKTFASKEFDEKAPVTLDHSGVYEFELKIPALARQKQGPIEVSMEYAPPAAGFDFRPQPHRTEFPGFEWKGNVVGSVRRRVFAVLVGISDYGGYYPPLRFAHMDAIDFAKLLMNDFEKEPALQTQEFVQLDINLFLSHGDSPATAALLSSMRTQENRLRQSNSNFGLSISESVGKGAILKKIEDYTKLPVGAGYQDTIIFFFSGHGYAKRLGGEITNYLILPESKQLDSAEFIQNTITTDEIAKYLRETANAEKLIIIDACREPVSSSLEPTDNMEDFVQSSRLKLAHLFVSTELGHLSFEKQFSPQFPSGYPQLFENPVDQTQNGNGIFTRTLLQALSCREGDPRHHGSVDPEGIKAYLDDFFDEQYNADLAALKDTVGSLPSPIARPDPDAPHSFHPWFRRLQPGAHTCIRQFDTQ
jgi:hypothetical protein